MVASWTGSPFRVLGMWVVCFLKTMYTVAAHDSKEGAFLVMLMHQLTMTTLLPTIMGICGVHGRPKAQQCATCRNCPCKQTNLSLQGCTVTLAWGDSSGATY